jgi:uncharacterized membrane protein YhaH (DUF805 family)
MKFGEAIDSVLLKNYFNLDGKATRSEYWWFCLFFCLSFFIFAIFTGITFGIAAALTGLTETAAETAVNYSVLGLIAVFFLPLLGLSVRRFADAGRGKREAIVIFVLAFISGLIAPMGDEAGAYIQVPEFFSIPALLVYGVTSLYTLYIALKKSV